MKVTIELPDDLYRQVKARAALEGRSVRHVAIACFTAWLADDLAPPDDQRADWLDRWLDPRPGPAASATTGRPLPSAGRLDRP